MKDEDWNGTEATVKGDDVKAPIPASRALSDVERQYGELLARCLKAESDRDSDMRGIGMLRAELHTARDAIAKAEVERDDLKAKLAQANAVRSLATMNESERMTRARWAADNAMNAAAKRNETIARLATECAEAHRELIQLRVTVNNEKAEAQRAWTARGYWVARAAEDKAIANEAMAVGLAECERLRARRLRCTRIRGALEHDT